MLSAAQGTLGVGALLWAQASRECSSLFGILTRGVAIGIACSIWLLFYNVILYPFYLSPLRHLPHPKQPPLSRRILGDPSYEKLVKWINEVPNDGLIRYYGFLNAERVLVTTPQGCKDVMQTQAYNYIKLPWALEVMGQFARQGILVAPPKKHKVDRKLLQPAFKFKYVKDLSSTFWSQGARFLNIIEKQIGESESGIIDIGERLQHVTLDIITLTSFGASIDAVANPGSSRVKHFRNLFSTKNSHLTYRALAFILPLPIYRRLPVKARNEIMTARDVIADFIRPLIQQRRNAMKEGATEKYAQGDIITTLLRSGETFSDDYLIDQSMDFMVAGQETTSTAIAFTLYALSNNPEVQSRLREEVREKLPSPSTGTTVDAALLESLPYLTAVCNETLRLFAPVVYCHRQTATSTSTIGPVSIPQDTVVTIAPGVVHESQKIWGPRAAEFDPERWLIRADGDVKVDPLGGTDDIWAVMPFTFGPRQCIGERFARGEMLALVAQLVGSFEWKFKGIGRNGDKPMKIVRTVVAGPAGGGLTMYAQRVGGW